MLDEAPRDGGSCDDRVTPVIKGAQLGKQLGAKPVTVAADPVDLHRLPHQATATLSRAATVRQRRRWWPEKSSAKTSSALCSRATAPSGWRHAPRPVNSPLQRTMRSRSPACGELAASRRVASAIAARPKTQGPHWRALCDAR